MLASRLPGAPVEERVTVFVAATANLFHTGVRDCLREFCASRAADCLCVSGGAVEIDVERAVRRWREMTTDQNDVDTALDALRQRSLSFLTGKECVNDIESALMLNCRDTVMMTLLCAAMASRLATNQGASASVSLRKVNTEMPAANSDATRRLVMTPSDLIWRIGAALNALLPRSIACTSVVAVCANSPNLRVFCPSLLDGTMSGELLSLRRAGGINGLPHLHIDLLRDIDGINRMAVKAKRSGVIILGGGVVKHHVLNANLMRNGADHAVIISTAQEFDGSDAGARPDEAVSWGKIRATAKGIKVYADAAVAFPLLVAHAFLPMKDVLTGSRPEDTPSSSNPAQ